MFGGDLIPPKCIPRARRSPALQDILLPGIGSSTYQHVGRNPNTDYHVKMLHYRQRREDFDKSKANSEKEKAIEDAFYIKHENHIERKTLQRSVEDIVRDKLQAYEETVEERRQRLHELFYKEERQYYHETVENAQKGEEYKMEEMKQRAATLKAQREAQRLEIVHQKRIDQYRNRCQELRPKLIQKHLEESKHSQLQQIRENEARREADRELDKMWHELTIKEIEAKKEREVQELLQRRNKEKESVEVWNKQVKGRELLKAEVQRVAEEDNIEMLKLSEQLRREEIEALDAKRRKRDRTAKELVEQIAAQEKLQAQRNKEEKALDQAFNDLAQLEIEREAAAIKDTTSQARREMAMYRKHLEQLEEERKQEQKQLEELLDFHRKEIEAKQDEARCKIIEAKRQLQQNVLAERAEQLKYKKQEAEEQLKLKQAENELLRMAFETNERLQAEYDRMEHEAALKYRDDLKRQIDYNNLLRQREKEEIERQLQQGLKEEEEYQRIVEQMLTQELIAGRKHPFRAVLEQYDCYCPPPK